MCEEFHGTFRQGIELNNLRMSEQIPSIQEQIDKEYQPFSIIANLILSYCRTGNINNPTGYQGDGKRFKIKLEQFRQNLLLSGDYDATGNYKQAVKKTAV